MTSYPLPNDVKINTDTISVDSMIAILTKNKSNKIKSHEKVDTSTLPQRDRSFDSPAAQSIIQRTPGDTGSKYDEGYTPGTSLAHYREANREQAMNNIFSIIGEVILGILLFVLLMFLIRFAIRKKEIIKKFFS